LNPSVNQLYTGREDQDADFFEVLVGQIAQNVCINIVIHKTLHILPQANLLSLSAIRCMTAIEPLVGTRGELCTSMWLRR
jgi:hypothetical protein